MWHYRELHSRHNKRTISMPDFGYLRSWGKQRTYWMCWPRKLWLHHIRCLIIWLVVIKLYNIKNGKQLREGRVGNATIQEQIVRMYRLCSLLWNYRLKSDILLAELTCQRFQSSHSCSPSWTGLEPCLSQNASYHWMFHWKNFSCELSLFISYMTRFRFYITR
jgi:hypothetical protein